MEKVFEIYIRTTPERLWEAITDGEIRSKYQFGARVTSEWTPGSRFEMGVPGTDLLLGEGEILEVDPPRRLVQTHDRALERRREARGRLADHLGDRAVQDSCRLTVVHDQLRDGAIPSSTADGR